MLESQAVGTKGEPALETWLGHRWFCLAGEPFKPSTKVSFSSRAGIPTCVVARALAGQLAGPPPRTGPNTKTKSGFYHPCRPHPPGAVRGFWHPGFVSEMKDAEHKCDLRLGNHALRYAGKEQTRGVKSQQISKSQASGQAQQASPSKDKLKSATPEGFHAQEEWVPISRRNVAHSELWTGARSRLRASDLTWQLQATYSGRPTHRAKQHCETTAGLVGKSPTVDKWCLAEKVAAPSHLYYRYDNTFKQF